MGASFGVEKLKLTCWGQIEIFSPAISSFQASILLGSIKITSNQRGTKCTGIQEKPIKMSFQVIRIKSSTLVVIEPISSFYMQSKKSNINVKALEHLNQTYCRVGQVSWENETVRRSICCLGILRTGNKTHGCF